MLSTTHRSLRTALTKAFQPLSSRAFSTYNDTIDTSSILVKKTHSPKVKTPNQDLLFGHTFTDHMLEVDWNAETGWGTPIIHEYQNFSLSPAIVGLHYGLQCFEGMKAYKDAQGGVRLFRPMMNMERMDSSMKRLAMPPLDKAGFLECIKELVRTDSSWVPQEDGYSLYIRPTAIGTSPFLGVHASEEVKVYCILSPVGPYYKTGAAKPVSLMADPKHVRAWPGGVGNVKVGGNYAPTIHVGAQAAQKGYSQILWLFGDDHEVTEVGAMNIFFVMKTSAAPDAPLELVTAPLDRGDVLPGVTRNSILQLCRSDWGKQQFGENLQVNERWVKMAEIVKARDEGRLVEAFGAGTAAIVSPVDHIGYIDDDIRIPVGEGSAQMMGRSDGASVADKVREQLLDIQYGRTEHEWSVLL